MSATTKDKLEFAKQQWFKTLDKPEKVCGCVYSLAGYALYLCPKHQREADNAND